MRIRIIIIITLTFNLLLYSQIDKKRDSGKMYKLSGVITDQTTNDTLSLVSVEILNKNLKRIKSTRSDFDGIYYFIFCSKKLISDTLLIKTTYISYKQETFFYKINSDSVINIKMSFDKNKTITKEKFEKYNSSFLYYECGTEDYDVISYDENKTYRHFCSGQEKKYQQLIKDNDNLSEWNLTEK